MASSWLFKDDNPIKDLFNTLQWPACEHILEDKALQTSNTSVTLRLLVLSTERRKRLKLNFLGGARPIKTLRDGYFCHLVFANSQHIQPIKTLQAFMNAQPNNQILCTSYIFNRMYKQQFQRNGTPAIIEKQIQ